MWDLIVSVPDHCLSFYFELTCLPVYMFTCRPFYLTFKTFKFKTRGVGACVTMQDVAG